MQCTKPFKLKEQNIEVPCGKCTSCRISRSREWTTRLLHEYAYHKTTGFITLTYDDEHLPIDEAINKNELVRFIKRLRKNRKEALKYYAIGEYGEEKGRPHYHAIMFGIGKEDYDEIYQTWSKGLIDIGTVTQHSIRYVTDYVHKENRIELYDYRTKPFSLQSKGLGLQWALDNTEHLRQNLGTTINGIPIGIPKYYRKKIEFDEEQIKDLAREKSREKDSLLYEYTKNHNTTTVAHRNKQREQKNRNVITKTNLYKKGQF
uniref:rolling circle replication-associated protein n=1 Tax=Candidatus Electrothrix sp. TaxID=2170559 RepID=UPI004056A67D